MTKTNIQSILFSTLVLVSLVSFIYLNTVNVEYTANENVEVVQDVFEEEEEDQGTISLPDVEMVKKMIEGGRKVIKLF